MEIKDDPYIKTETTVTQDRVLTLATQAEGRNIHYDVIPRFEFYERAKKVYAVVSTLEATPYSCFLLKKGVINN
jgi:L-fucose mutarotase